MDKPDYKIADTRALCRPPQEEETNINLMSILQITDKSFKKIDTDESGRLSKAEIEHWSQSPGLSDKDRQAAQFMFKNYDCLEHMKLGWEQTQKQQEMEFQKVDNRRGLSDDDITALKTLTDKQYTARQIEDSISDQRRRNTYIAVGAGIATVGGAFATVLLWPTGFSAFSGYITANAAFSTYDSTRLAATASERGQELRKDVEQRWRLLQSISGR